MKRWLRWLLQLLSLFLFGLILWWAGPDVWRQVLGGDLQHVFIAFLLLGTATLLSAVRLRLVAQSLAGRRLGSLRRFYYLNIATRAMGVVIPRTLSTFAGKPVALRSLGLPLKRSVWIVLMDNLFDLLLLGALAIPALLFLGARASATGTLVLALALVLVLTGGLWWITGGSGALRLLAWRKRVPYLEAALRRLPDEATDLLPRRPAAVQSLALTLLLILALAACYYHISCAVGLSHPWTIFAAGFPAVQLSLVLAVTPAGLGVFDAGWYGALLLGGVSHQDALTFVVAQRAYISVFVLIWAGLGTLLSLTVDR